MRPAGLKSVENLIVGNRAVGEGTMIGAICFFLVGAAAGAFLAVRHFLKRGMPGWVAVAHGLAGASGFLLVLLVCVREPAFTPARLALGILVVAIALGCVNVVYHLRRMRHRTAIIVAHALCALAGVGTLAYAAFIHDVRMASAATPGVVGGASIRETATSAEASADAPRAAFAPGDRDKPPSPQATGQTPETAPSARGAVHRSARRVGWAWRERAIQFGNGLATPTDSSIPEVAAIAEELKAEPEVTLVEVQGHADERGGEADNLELTRARARAVVDALVDRGVERARLRAEGYGSRCAFQPACREASAPKSCHEESSWQRDRRVTLLVVASSGERLRGPSVCDRAVDPVAGETPPPGARPSLAGAN
jgi:outer membrane protein OmpA-like peptidoglycan-associated protein